MECNSLDYYVFLVFCRDPNDPDVIEFKREVNAASKVNVVVTDFRSPFTKIKQICPTVILIVDTPVQPAKDLHCVMADALKSQVELCVSVLEACEMLELDFHLDRVIYYSTESRNYLEPVFRERRYSLRNDMISFCHNAKFPVYRTVKRAVEGRQYLPTFATTGHQTSDPRKQPVDDHQRLVENGEVLSKISSCMSQTVLSSQEPFQPQVFVDLVVPEPVEPVQQALQEQVQQPEQDQEQQPDQEQQVQQPEQEQQVQPELMDQNEVEGSAGVSDTTLSGRSCF